MKFIWEGLTCRNFPYLRIDKGESIIMELHIINWEWGPRNNISDYSEDSEETWGGCQNEIPVNKS
jgi:hypothetical protein